MIFAPFATHRTKYSYAAMRLLSMIAALAMAGATVDLPSPQSRTILLFGARWCAPCMAEYADLAAIESAAAPDRIVLAWVDRRIAPPPSLAGRVGSLEEKVARRLATDIAGEGYGVPLAVMLDADGKPCAIRRSGLRPSLVADMRAECRSFEARHGGRQLREAQPGVLR